MVSFHWLFPSLEGETCPKIYSISELYLCFGFIFLEIGIKSGEHKNAIPTQTLSNIQLNLSKHTHFTMELFLRKPEEEVGNFDWLVR